MFYKKHRQSEHGFTLLEVEIVLFILCILAAAAIPATSGLIAHERLKSQAKLLQDYAISARKLAVTEDRPYEIVLDATGFSLQRLSAGEKKKEDVVDSVKLSSNVGYNVQHWGEDKFGKPAGESWIFRPDGICEPIRVHFENKEGWIEYAFNPLTAKPQDESDHFP